MKRFCLIFSVIIFIVINIFVYVYAQTIDFHSGYNNPLFSADNEHILFAGDNHNGVYIYNITTDEILQISSGKSSGYKYYWSVDGSKVGFKVLLEQEGDKFLQVPVVYDIYKKKYICLTEPVSLCGIPSFSADGKIVYSLSNKIVILDDKLNILKEIPTRNYSNITPVSPDGSKILYNDDNDQIWLVELNNLSHTKLTDDKEGYYNPVWSPDSKKVILNTISGHIKVVDINSKKIFYVDKGLAPCWNNDSQYLFYHKIEVVDGLRVTRSVVSNAKYDGTDKNELTTDTDGLTGNCSISLSGNRMVYKLYNSGEFYILPVNKTKNSILGLITKTGFSLDKSKKTKLMFGTKKNHILDKDIIDKYKIKIKR